MQYKFISFEGVEGSGKSTQAKLLHQILTQKNIKATLTREPGGTKASEVIREVLLSENWPKLESKTEIFLNFAARIEHVQKTIKPALKNDEIVICDRFFDSTLAYQGYGFGCDLDFITKINEMSIDNFAPDITFLIDTPIEVSFPRIKNRQDNNRYEKLDENFHQNVRQGFLALAKNNPRIKIIDGTQTIDEITTQIVEILKI